MDTVDLFLINPKLFKRKNQRTNIIEIKLNNNIKKASIIIPSNKIIKFM